MILDALCVHDPSYWLLLNVLYTLNFSTKDTRHEDK